MSYDDEQDQGPAWRCPLCLENWPFLPAYKCCPECSTHDETVECRRTGGAPTRTVREANDAIRANRPAPAGLHRPPPQMDENHRKFEEHVLRQETLTLMSDLDEWAKLSATPDFPSSR